MTLRIVVVRRERNVSSSMDVCADNIVVGLKAVRPGWTVIEASPAIKDENEKRGGAMAGLRRYYERFWHHPRAVRRLKGDIFHIIDHSDAHVAYWLKRKNSAVVVTCHDLVQFVYPEILKDAARFPAFSLASWKYSVEGMKHADRVIAVSSNTAKDVAQMLQVNPERISVVPNGVESYFHSLDPEEIAEVRQHYEGSPETFCLLNVGVTQQRKNISTVLEVLASARNRGIPVRLWKVGDGFTAEQTDFIQSQNLDQLITWIDKPSKATLLKLYNAADALLAPSLYEGFGLTIVEAMACGTPVITSNVSSLPEVVGSAAFSVAPFDVEAMTEAIIRIKQDPDYRNYLVQAGLLQARSFSWNKAAEQIARVYEAIILEKEDLSKNVI